MPATATTQSAPNCPACGGTAQPWLIVPDDWRRPKTGAWRLWWCDACRYGWVWPRPRAQDIGAFYDVEYYTHADQEASGASRRSLLRRLLEHAAWRLDKGRDLDAAWFGAWLPDQGARAIDLGAGSGVFADQLRAAGADVLAVEQDPKARDAIRERGIPVMDGLCESLPRQIERGAYDLTLLSHVLEHALDPAKALRESASTLKPGGVLVVEVPNNQARGLEVSGACWHWLDVPRHLNFFTRDSLVASVERAGLTVESVEFVGFCRQFQGPWADAEAHIASVFLPDSPRPVFATSAGQARLLLKTAMAPDELRYDSVRVIARR